MKEQVISMGRVKRTGHATREVVYIDGGKSRTEHHVLVGGLWLHEPAPDVITPVRSAPTSPGDPTPNLKECLHVDDVLALVSKAPDKNPPTV